MSEFMPIAKWIRKNILVDNPLCTNIDGTDVIHCRLAQENENMLLDWSNPPAISIPSEFCVVEASNGTFNNADVSYAILYDFEKLDNKIKHYDDSGSLVGGFKMREVMFVKHASSPICALATRNQWVDLCGHMHGERTFSPSSKYFSQEEIDRMANDEKVPEFMAMFDMSLMILVLLACKNVSTKEAEEKVSRQVRRQNERNGTGEYRYHVLQISGNKATKSKSESVSENLTALHIRRGHFARYTEAAPLFGKHVGTFYIPQHWAGSKEVGLVDKDYKLVVK